MTNAFLGILSLDTAFERIKGDIGNPDTYPFAARVHVVTGADSQVIVQDAPPPPALLAAFVDAARTLEARGAAAIVSTCGFLITSQDHIARAVNIPVMVSALSLYPMVRATTAGKIGILTASQPALGPNALAAAGIDSDAVAIAGLSHIPLFAETFLARKSQQRSGLDPQQMEQAVVNAALSLQTAHPDLAALILECGNLPPYAPALRRALGLPVFHLADAASHLMAAQNPASL